MFSKLNIPEKLLLGFFTYLAVGTFFFPLDARQRLVVWAANSLAMGVMLSVSTLTPSGRNAFPKALRPWIPSFFILAAYRESGLFFTPDPSHRLDHLFIRFDQVILQNSWVLQILDRAAPWPQYYLELSYLLCYPIVPLGLASLYWVKNRASQDSNPAAPAWEPAMEHFWTAVLLASFTCYLLFPLSPLAPPRELFNDIPGPRVAPLLRSLNHWLLGKYAVGASLFPSAHVAATTAAALAIRRYLPRIGWVFVLVAVSIGIATVYGRYHYALDAVAGGLVGVSAYFVSCWLMKRKLTVGTGAVGG